MEKLKSYIKPTSSTWWVGIGLIMSGLLRVYSLEIPGVSDVIRPMIDTFFPLPNPGQLILTGLGFIGFRAAIGRSV